MGQICYYSYIACKCLTFQSHGSWLALPLTSFLLGSAHKLASGAYLSTISFLFPFPFFLYFCSTWNLEVFSFCFARLIKSFSQNMKAVGDLFSENLWPFSCPSERNNLRSDYRDWSGKWNREGFRQFWRLRNLFAFSATLNVIEVEVDKRHPLIFTIFSSTTQKMGVVLGACSLCCLHGIRISSN